MTRLLKTLLLGNCTHVLTLLTILNNLNSSDTVMPNLTMYFHPGPTCACHVG